MKPTDVRNDKWIEIADQLSARRAEVLIAWQIYGPGTTRGVAERAGIDILSVRPRTTELLSIGLIEMTGRKDGQGIYQVVAESVAVENFAQFQKIVQSGIGGEAAFLGDKPF